MVDAYGQRNGSRIGVVIALHLLVRLLNARVRVGLHLLGFLDELRSRRKLLRLFRLIQRSKHALLQAGFPVAVVGVTLESLHVLLVGQAHLVEVELDGVDRVVYVLVHDGVRRLRFGVVFDEVNAALGECVLCQSVGSDDWVLSLELYKVGEGVLC